MLKLISPFTGLIANMSFTRFSSAFYLLSFSLLLQTVLAKYPIFHTCSGTSFDSREAYGSNLDHLVKDLILRSPPTGFSTASIGQDNGQAYGLAQCKSGITGGDCKTCIEEASSRIRKLCPSNRAAVAWYDNCMFKYSDHSFFRSIDDQNSYYRCNRKSTGDDTKKFHQRKDALLRGLVSNAQGSPSLFATSKISLGKSGQLYGLAQCTRDLSPTHCKRCLNGVIRSIRSLCDRKTGGTFGNGSCNIRYELYPFFNA